MDQEWIALDFAGWGGHTRYTHYPSGKTLLRQPYMSDARWQQEKDKYFMNYPGVPVLGYKSRRPVDIKYDIVEPKEEGK